MTSNIQGGGGKEVQADSQQAPAYQNFHRGFLTGKIARMTITSGLVFGEIAPLKQDLYRAEISVTHARIDVRSDFTRV